MKKKESLLIVLGIIFISFNLRAPITAVGSLVEMIKAEYMMSNATAGFITTLPLIAFSLVSPFVAGISHKLGYGKTMGLGLILILIGEVVRSYTNLTGLFIGTAFLGVGIAIGNVLIPGIIKLKFPDRVGLITSFYTSSMLIFAAVGAGISVPLASELNLGWRSALASWFFLTSVTFIIWSPQLKVKGNRSSSKIHPANLDNKLSSGSVWRSPIAWSVTLFMGIQSFVFYSLVAWLPTIIISKGMTATFAGTMALTYQLTGIPTALIIPLFCDRFKNQRGLVFITFFLYISGMTLLLISQTQVSILISVLLMSLAMGGSISLSIAFISMRSPNSKRAAELSGMAQTAGYLLAAVGPILMGMIYDLFENWSFPIMIFIGLIVIFGIAGWFAGDNRVIQE